MSHLDDYSRAQSALPFIDAHDRQVWVSVGGALKNEFGDQGFELWDEWSASAQNYDAKAAKSTWRSLKPVCAGKTSTIATVYHYAKQGGWTPEPLSSSDEQQLTRERAERRKKREQEWAAARDLEKHNQVAVAQLANQIWQQCKPFGRSQYLGKKQVGAHGVRFPKVPMVAVIKDKPDGSVECDLRLSGIRDFFAGRDKDWSILYLKPTDCFLVPLMDAKGRIWNLQVVFVDRKRFLKHGRKSGLFHLIAPDSLTGSPHTPLCIAEGYATAATIHQACKWPVVVAFDAGNLLPVAKQTRQRWPDRKIVICGDNDAETPGNPGKRFAEEAAAAINATAVIPEFENV